jgi:hypothetical protein
MACRTRRRRGADNLTPITVPQPPGLYGPLMYPTSITGTAGLTLDFTVIHPISRRGTEYACDENALLKAHRAKVTKHHEWLQAKNYCFVPVVAATSRALRSESLRLLYDFTRLKTDAAKQHADANSLRLPLTSEQLCQRRGATFARLRMGAQLCSLRASATRLTGKHWAALYASSLLPRSRARARCGVGAFAPAPAARVLASRQWCGPGTFCMRVSSRGLPASALHSFSLCDLRLFVSIRMFLSFCQQRLPKPSIPRSRKC